MIDELEIRKELVRFLSNEISIDQFEDWLVYKSWNMHQDSLGSAQRLVSAIEASLVEYSEDSISLEALRSKLKSYAIDVNVMLPCDREPIITIGSWSYTIRRYIGFAT